MREILKNKYLKKGILIITFLCFILGMEFFYSNVKAESNGSKDFVIILDEAGQKSVPIFSENDGLWAPGATKSKKFIMNNTSKYGFIFENANISLGITDHSNNKIQEDSKIYEEFLKSLEMVLSDEDGVLYQGKLFDLYHGDNVIVSMNAIPAYTRKMFNVKVSMEKSSNNFIQDLNGKCEISVLGRSIDGGNVDGGIVKTGTFLDFRMLLGIGSLILFAGLFILINKREHRQLL
jgi:hypothetical protein